MESLDNPIWFALTTEQAGFARARGGAACFPSAVTSLAGLRAPDSAATDDLAALLEPGERTGLFVSAPLELSPALTVGEQDELLQMVHTGDAPAEPADDVVELGPPDRPAMLALAERTRPGPFGARTSELGTFLGIRRDGALIAMAGQRLRLDRFIEVSAICTDPDHLGRGYATRLTGAMVARIRAAGATPFLHVRASNRRAVAVYAQVGFQVRRTVRYLVVSR